MGRSASLRSQAVFLLTVEADERGDLVLKRTTDLGKSFTTVHEDIFSFGYIGAFLFFSVMEDPVRVRDSYLHGLDFSANRA